MELNIIIVNGIAVGKVVREDKSEGGFEVEIDNEFMTGTIVRDVEVKVVGLFNQKGHSAICFKIGERHTTVEILLNDVYDVDIQVYGSEGLRDFQAIINEYQF